MIDFLERLSNAFGAPGFEGEVAEEIRKACAGDFLVEGDSLGNLFLYRKNHDPLKPNIMLDAHMDEVGFIIQSINSNGSLRFLPLGSMVPQTVYAQRVLIRNGRGDYVKGIVGSQPPHFGMNPEDSRDLASMFIDVGSSSREETLELFGIEPGCPAVPDTLFASGPEDLLMGKAFDDRIGCVCLIETMRALGDRELPYNVVGSLSVQEEVGSRGAKVALHRLKPVFGVVFEGTPADDTFTEALHSQGKLGGGTQIRLFDRSIIANPRVASLARKIAGEKGLPCQVAVRSGGGTNAGYMHMDADPVPVLILGAPVRYAHTGACFSRGGDMRATVNLAAAFLGQLTPEALASF